MDAQDFLFLPMSVLSQGVIAPPRKSLVVGVADMVASNDAGANLITYSLGSCLGIAIYDPIRKAGGLLHIMLPDSTIDAQKAASQPYMFVDTGVPRLFHAVYNLAGERHRLVLKVAGGAQLLDPGRIFNIGTRNFQALTEILSRNGIAIQAKDVGGASSRTMNMDLGTGQVTIKSPGTETYIL